MSNVYRLIYIKLKTWEQVKPTLIGMINLQELIATVREASALMNTPDFKIESKGGFSNIVTSSDMAVQDFLMQRLSAQLPGAGFLCEEKDVVDTSHEFTFIIDPIDGTANYARGIQHCAIAVGLRKGCEMVMAVVYVPWTNELFSAEKGRGAWLNGEPIHVSDRPFENGVICTAFSVYHKEHTAVCKEIIAEVFTQANDFRRFGAAAPELCYVAMGRCEMYFEYLLSPWDYAAASLILQEAGGFLCNRKGERLSCVDADGVLAANSMENLKRLTSIVRSKTGE